MAVDLTEPELESFLGAAHTGVLTTLRRDGSPLSVPMWFVLTDGHVYLRTRARAAKVEHIRSDPRVCFVVEDGMAWADLRAVVLSGRARLVDDPDEQARALESIVRKYEGYGADRRRFTTGTSRRYGGDVAVIRIDIVGSTRSWDNRKVRLVEPAAAVGTTPQRQERADG